MNTVFASSFHTGADIKIDSELKISINKPLTSYEYESVIRFLSDFLSKYETVIDYKFDYRHPLTKQQYDEIILQLATKLRDYTFTYCEKCNTHQKGERFSPCINTSCSSRICEVCTRKFWDHSNVDHALLCKKCNDHYHPISIALF